MAIDIGGDAMKSRSLVSLIVGCWGIHAATAQTSGGFGPRISNSPSLAQEYNARLHDPVRDRTEALREEYRALAAKQGGNLTEAQAAELRLRYQAIIYGKTRR